MIVASFLSQILGLAQSPAEADGAVGETSPSGEFGDLLATSLAASSNSIATGAPEILNGSAIPNSAEQKNELSLDDKDDKKSAVGLADGLMFASPLWFQPAQPGPQVALQSAQELSFDSGDSNQPVGASALTFLSQWDSASSETQTGFPVVQNGGDSVQPSTVAEPAETAVAKNPHSELLSGMADALAADASRAPAKSIIAPELNQSVKAAAQASVKPEATFDSAALATAVSEAAGENLSAQAAANQQHADMAAPIAAATLTAQEPATPAIATAVTDAIDSRVGKAGRNDSILASKSAQQVDNSDRNDAVSIDTSKPAANDQPPLRQPLLVEREGIAPVDEKNNQNRGTNSGRQSEAFERPIAATFHVGSTSVAPENSKDGQLSTIRWQPVIERVAGEIAGRLRIGKQEAVLQLDPPELGKIRIDLRVDGDKIEARISAVEHSARTLLENHLPELRHALEVGQVRSADVNIDNRSWSGASGNDGSQGSQESFQRGAQQGNRQEGALAGALSGSLAPACSERAGDGQNRISMWA